jgi:N-acetylglutamate synthase-like GNAT family acetyltransferase
MMIYELTKIEFTMDIYNDLTALLWLDNPEEPQNNYETLKKIVQNLPSNQIIFVYIENNNFKKHIVGIVTLLIKQNLNTLCDGIIEDLKVSLSDKNENITEQLLKHIEEFALKKNCKHLFINCINYSVKFFGNFGFKKSNHPTNLYKTIDKFDSYRKQLRYDNSNC